MKKSFFPGAKDELMNVVQPVFQWRSGSVSTRLQFYSKARLNPLPGATGR